MSKTKYCTMIDSSTVGLVIKVNELLDEGWELYGNPYSSIQQVNGILLYHVCQAMIKKEYSDYNPF